MRHSIVACATALVTLLGITGPASAEDVALEMDFGFFHGTRVYDEASFSYEEGSASPAILGPFRGEPFSRVESIGPDTELRMIINHVRMTFGYSRPYARFVTPFNSQLITAGTESTSVQVRAIRSREIRIGIGAELDLGELAHYQGVAGFADLMGTADLVHADLVAGDQQSTYSASSFSFSLRGGFRVPITEYFFAQAIGEYGLVGNIGYGGRFGVGLRFE